eukprot:4319295-Pyramimonas_sp.AAC.1
MALRWLKAQRSQRLARPGLVSPRPPKAARQRPLLPRVTLACSRVCPELKLCVARLAFSGRGSLSPRRSKV